MLSFFNWDVWGKISLPPSSGKKTKHISVFICLVLSSQQPPHWLFLLVILLFLLSPGEGSHASYSMEAWVSSLGSHLVSVGIHAEREEWTSKIKKKISLGKCHWKVKKALSTISFRLCFLLFWVSKVNQRNRAESWDCYSWVFKAFPHPLKKNNKLHLHNAYSSFLSPKLSVQRRREVKY